MKSTNLSRTERNWTVHNLYIYVYIKPSKWRCFNAFGIETTLFCFVSKPSFNPPPPSLFYFLAILVVVLALSPSYTPLQQHHVKAVVAFTCRREHHWIPNLPPWVAKFENLESCNLFIRKVILWTTNFETIWLFKARLCINQEKLADA